VGYFRAIGGVDPVAIEDECLCVRRSQYARCWLREAWSTHSNEAEVISDGHALRAPRNHGREQLGRSTEVEQRVDAREACDSAHAGEMRVPSGGSLESGVSVRTVM